MMREGFTSESNTSLKKSGSNRWLYYYSIILLFLLICSCGYRIGPAGEHIDKEVKNVFVESFINKTSEAHVENLFRKAFIDQLIKGRRFNIVDSADTADAVFKGTINILITTPLAHKKSNVAAEERITVTMDLSFVKQSTAKNIWTHSSFTGVQDYVFDNLTLREHNRKGALSKLSNDLAEKAYDLMVSGF